MWVKPWQSVLVAGLVLVAQPATAVDIAIGKPPGRMYDVGGYDLQMYCTGEGSPVVVIDTGLGSSSLEWLEIQHAMGRETRVCSYDRAGYGWSDGGPGPRTVSLLAEELNRLLDRADVDPPYVLVGHSFGGYIVQYYAETRADKVAGLVLVESSHPEQAARLRDLVPGAAGIVPNEPLNNPVNEWLLNRSYGDPRGGPADIGNFLNSRRKAIFAQMDELEHFTESGRQVTAKRPLPEMPLVVLARGRPAWTSTDGGEQLELAWQQLQQELSQLTRQGELRIAGDSGHHVHRDQPALVINAIRDVVQASRTNMNTAHAGR